METAVVLLIVAVAAGYVVRTLLARARGPAGCDRCGRGGVAGRRGR